ncbi:MAG: nucleotidyltransferase domain-containing protein [Bacteroidaceae bacterium]|nr:nucleotidyltransferase domain-containing protein [Bacteroidaceae bacterium]
MEMINHLHSVEQEYSVKILLAVESGSRAWGFESKNSDWDVRFIYVQKPQWYFTIEPQRDVIEIMDDPFDLVGWELRKALALLKRNNPSLLEWINSPIVYYADEEFLGHVRSIATQFFNPIASMYHYNHMYIKHDERYLQRKDCSMKRFLYYLRGILSCKWIEENKTLPPVAFDKLVAATVEDSEMEARISTLVQLKKDGKEHDLQVVDKDLMDYAHNLANYYTEHISAFRPNQNDVSSEVLDSFLYDTVRRCSPNVV